MLLLLFVEKPQGGRGGEGGAVMVKGWVEFSRADDPVKVPRCVGATTHG